MPDHSSHPTMSNSTKGKQTIILNSYSIYLVFVFITVILLGVTDAKDFIKKDSSNRGNLCIARFESATGEPLYYNCPRVNEDQKKSYCCYLDKCCDYKEFRKQTEQQHKMTQGVNYGYIAKGAIGTALKVILWVVFLIILLIVGCCCLTFFACRKKKLFNGGIFNSPLPAQPPGPSPYAAPTDPYMAYGWPPEVIPPAPTTGAGAPPPPPAYPNPSYPPYPSGNPTSTQPPYNPNFK